MTACAIQVSQGQVTHELVPASFLIFALFLFLISELIHVWLFRWTGCFLNIYNDVWSLPNLHPKPLSS